MSMWILLFTLYHIFSNCLTWNDIPYLRKRAEYDILKKKLLKMTILLRTYTLFKGHKTQFLKVLFCFVINQPWKLVWWPEINSEHKCRDLSPFFFYFLVAIVISNEYQNKCLRDRCFTCLFNYFLYTYQYFV